MAVVRISCLTGLLSAFFIPSVSAQALPGGWLAADIGNPSITGSSDSADGRAFAIGAAGSDIWGTSDQFHFVYQPVDGDVEMIARIEAISYAHAWSKAGVMIRSSLTAGAAHGYALVSAGKGIAFQRRTAAGGLSAHTAGAAAVAPYWVRIVRRGTLVTTYASPTGGNWTAIGSDTIALGQTAYVGLAVTSHADYQATAARVGEVSIQPLGLPAPFQSRDLGTPLAGSAKHQNGTFTVQGAGTDIWGVADEGHFVYQPVTGDVDIRARVASLQFQHRWSKGGVMVRETMAAGARHAFALTSAGAGYGLQRRLDPGGWSTHTDGGAGAPPGWVRLVRTGDQFTAYRSSDGRTWAVMGQDSIPMSATVYVGLAITSHNAAAASQGVFDNVTITQSQAAPNQPPTVTLTSPASGATFAAPASVTVSAAAADPEGRMARVAFYANGALIGTDTTAPFAITWSSVGAGSYSVVAVAEDADGASATSGAAAISVGASLSPPRLVSFTASSDHAVVTSYRLEIFASGVDPATATPVATSELGKPTPDASGNIAVDRSTLFSGLPAGSYGAVVVALKAGATSRSTVTAFTR